MRIYTSVKIQILPLLQAPTQSMCLCVYAVCVSVSVLPDGIVGNVSVLGMDSSHQGAFRRILLYLKSVTGSYEHRGLICILHWYLQTRKHTELLKGSCDIYLVTHTHT